jgi:hypothetical protein
MGRMAYFLVGKLPGLVEYVLKLRSLTSFPAWLRLAVAGFREFVAILVHQRYPDQAPPSLGSAVGFWHKMVVM